MGHKQKAFKMFLEQDYRLPSVTYWQSTTVRLFHRHKLQVHKYAERYWTNHLAVCTQMYGTKTLIKHEM